MKNHLILFLFSSMIFSSCTCNLEKGTAPTDTTPENGTPTKTEEIEKPSISPPPPFELFLPKSYTLLKKASGDLDKDGRDEKVVVLNTSNEGDFGTEREIQIYTLENNQWKMWHRSTGAVLPSEHGGVMGDPFEDVSIENGAIVFKHLGGSRSKWAYAHRFRFQNDRFELIGATVVNDTPCESSENFDYNLSTGNVVYKKEIETCEGDERKVVKKEKDNFKYKMKELPQMDGFSFDKPLYAVNSKTGKCFPESACYNYKEENTNNEEEIDENSLTSLEGIYTLGGHHDSWAVVIKNGQVKYYEINGMLPPEDSQLKIILEQGNPKILQQFNVDFAKMSFQSDLGKGKIEKGKSITFLEMPSHIDDFLTLSLQ